MFSIPAMSVRKTATAILFASAALISTSAAKATDFTGVPPGGIKLVCISGTGNILIPNSSDDCTAAPGESVAPTGFTTGNAVFSDTSNSTTFVGGTVQVNAPITITGPTTINATTTFGGSSVTFNTPTTFQNPSTFNGAATFSGALTASNAQVTGTLGAATLNSTQVNAGGITVASSLSMGGGALVHLGFNVVQGVAAGTAGTDAVNVNQLNAATSGITTNVTALQTLTATHTTQIADIQTVNSTQATQISALQAADLAFESAVDSLGNRIGKVDDRASAGTAAAVALSGAMFLPGKSFNLTGNVGTYRGAHAAALQFGALVSDNVALNAGIAHGFNKGGKTALRAGFTVGW